jgi:hypothetical protein
MSEVEELARDLERVNWRRVDGVSASTAAAFAERLRNAE